MMPNPVPDDRTEQRKADDERIANEPPLPSPQLPAGAKPRPLEAFLPTRKPVAWAGVVEDGKVRILDPDVQLAENAHVIVIATQRAATGL